MNSPFYYGSLSPYFTKTFSPPCNHKHTEYSDKDHKHPEYVDLDSPQTLNNKTLLCSTRFSQASFIVGTGTNMLHLPDANSTLVDLITRQVLRSKILNNPIIEVPDIRNIEVKTDDWFSSDFLDHTRTLVNHYTLGWLNIFYLYGVFRVPASGDQTWGLCFSVRHKNGNNIAHNCIMAGRGFITAAQNKYEDTLLNVKIDEMGFGYLWRGKFAWVANRDFHVFCIYIRNSSFSLHL